jgi:tetratricopeptide (TPR) repeat protein
MGRYDEAMSNYRKVTELKPAHLEAIINLGNVLRIKGDFDEAISFFNQALVIKPVFASTYNNLGAVFKDKGDLDDAILHYKKALELDDGFAEAHNNLGMALQEKRQFENAENSFRKAIQLNGNLAEAHFNLASVLLLTGNLQEGWEEYEWRLQLKESNYTLAEKLWDGSDIRGRSLLLFAEQGFGDTIQFMRYAPLVAERGITVIVACQQELAALLRRVKGVNRVIAFGESLPAFDFQCHLLSLPRIFNTTLANIPANTPYITADPLAVLQSKKNIASDQSKLKVGIAWAGDPSYKKDRLRSLKLIDILPLIQMKDISFYKLQKENSADQGLPLNEELKLIDFTYLIQDFDDAAAFMENLDLVISVDTSIAHLAGALGKPVWTLLPYVPDWRWMLEREDSPWYPTMRLFRQPSPGDWDSVMNRVAEELKKIDVK